MRMILALVFVWSVTTTAYAEKAVHIEIEQKDIDIPNRTIHFSLGSVAASAEIQVHSPEGKVLHTGHKEFDHPAAGTRLEIGWPDLGANQENFLIDLKLIDSEGSWAMYHVVRFYFEIPHEDVEFASGKAVVTPDQRAKLDKPLALLDDAIAKYSKMMDIGLYVVGHTDTVGPASDNQRLSDKRAQAIAAVFIQHGLKPLPIFVRGCGEGVPAVKTADNVAEAKNRRAQYIVSSFVPEFAGPGNWHRVQ